jgi:DNA-binding TFAR19-related protein (PDSD5 family)
MPNRRERLKKFKEVSNRRARSLHKQLVTLAYSGIIKCMCI